MSPIGDTWELVDADRIEVVHASQHGAVISGHPAEFSVIAKGAPALAYQWRLNGNNLHNGAVISGANTSVLRIHPATFAHPGQHDVLITNDCDAVVSTTANLTVVATRFGDGDFDDDIDLADVALLNGCLTGAGVVRSAGCESFDFDGDGDVDLNDVREFQLVFGS